MRGLEAVCLATADYAASFPKAVFGEASSATGVLPRLFPLSPAVPRPVSAPGDNNAPLRLPGGAFEFGESPLRNLFALPDWHPDSHGPMPATRMLRIATVATEADIAAASAYFAAQRPRPRVKVIERARIPRMLVKDWIYVIDSQGGEEVLGPRSIEWTLDAKRHEMRDDMMRYNVFVPPESVARGRIIVNRGLNDNVALACVICHGTRLQGSGEIPPLAGRSPTYMLRQLMAFQTRDQSGVNGARMQPVVAGLFIEDMMALSAYAATL